MARKLRYNDEEGGMVKAQLQKIEMYAAKLNDMIHPDDEIEGWVQAKLAVVAAYMGDVKHYLDYELKENFADGGGVKMNERYWEVEFTWDGEPEGDGRKVTVMADSVSEAEKKVKEKFGAYYKGLRIVEVEEDKPISEMYKDDDDDDKDDDDDFPKKRYRKMSDGGIYNEPYITYHELWDKLKEQGHQFDNEVDFAVVANKAGYTWDDDAEQWFQMANGGVTDAAVVDDFGSMSFRNQYDEWEMVVVSKELEKDGGRFHKDRFLVSAKDIDEAKKIATELWKKEFGDSDLSIVKVMSDSLYKLKYIDTYAEGGMTPLHLQDMEMASGGYMAKGGMMAEGGQLIGNQKKLDLNKNGKLDAEDFRMLRERKKARSKMADGGMMDDGGDLDFMKDFEKNFTTAYVLQTKQDLESRQAEEPYQEASDISPRKKRWYEFADGGEVKKIVNGFGDGRDVYLTYIDSTHFFLSDSPDQKGNAYHIGQFSGKEPQYIWREVREWLKSHNKGGISNRKIVDFVKTLEAHGLAAKNAHENKTFLTAVRQIISMNKKDFDEYIKEHPNKSVLLIYSEYQDWEKTYADGGQTKEPVYVEIAKPTDLSLNKIRRKVEELADMGYRSGDILLKMLFTTDEPSALTNQFQKLKNRVFFLKDFKKYKNGGKMEDYIRNEGSSWAEDFAEAKEYLGDEIWNEMSREDKIQAVNYLKAKGRIGYGPEFEDLATVAAMQYKRGGKS
jgi:hypothetical protein